MAQSIRVLHLITGLNTGGAEMALSRLLAAMNKQEFESRVVSLIKPGPVGMQIEALGIPLQSLEMPPGRATLTGFLKLTHLLRDFRPHILQTWMYHADLLGLIAGKLTGIPAIAWNIRCSEMNYKNSQRLSKMVVGICAALSGWPQTVVVNSRAGQAAHEKLGYHPRNWQFVPNGIDTTQLFPDQSAGIKVLDEWNISEEIDIVGMVARLDPQKDHPNFLRAAAIVLKEKPDVRFICVGSGPQQILDKLKEQAKNLGLGQNILWAGPRTNMPAVFNTFNLSVSSSAYGEGFPNVVAEAMACGVPCVSTKIGDAQDIVADTGVIVPPHDHQALAAAILQILNLSVEKRKLMGTLARQRIIANFSLEKMAYEYTNLYRHLARLQKDQKPE